MRPELPEVRQATLSEDDLEALFRDVSMLVELESVSRRGGADGDQGETTLPEAREILRSPSREAIQLRYAHDGWDWIDTLVREGEGFQLTRMAITSDPAPS